MGDVLQRNKLYCNRRAGWLRKVGNYVAIHGLYCDREVGWLLVYLYCNTPRCIVTKKGTRLLCRDTAGGHDTAMQGL